ncbi:Wzz/FepE/Etk N-terminal domain-containing protein [Gallaecimonas pentaromativorans]|uniref:Putative tyrosine kinase-like protein n=1 Tax=Gallaecimonas pentaromativorans TaxID=584787 RepID=A0A3N1NUM5_9GAMM|nr:Wzz/FepE/Etk N-terminal domain-containing protein [Gallaecimonas pentaromativorans]ROQ22542.1 putative tyrosine kinase-like protein [Gallaecimonas pentaromativorans]
MKDAEFPTSQHYQPQLAIQDDEIDLRELFAAIWRGKWLVITCTAFFAIASVAIALYLPNIYKSEVLLAPAEQQQQGGIAGLAGQFGGLASLAGINLGGGSTDKTTLALQVLQSREFIGNFIDKHQILVPLMAAKGWNRDTDSLIWDTDVYNPENKTWVRKVKPPFQPKPSAQEAYKEFTKNILSSSQDKETGMVTVSVSFYSPEMSQQWATWLVKDLNDVMRQRDMAEAKKSIQYLDEQINKTNLTDLRTMLYQLVEQQTKTLMFAEVRDEYVFKTVDPAIVPEEKDKPKRALICVLGTLLGGMLGVMIVLVRHFSRKS